MGVRKGQVFFLTFFVPVRVRLELCFMSSHSHVARWPPPGIFVWSQQRESWIVLWLSKLYQWWYSSLCSSCMVQNKSRVTPLKGQECEFPMCLEGENWKHGSRLSSRIPVGPWKHPLPLDGPHFPLRKMKLIVQNSWRIDCHPRGEKAL